MYLLDANVFIEAKQRYYSFDLCPGFWEWLDRAHTEGRVASVRRIKDELAGVGDELSEWAAERPGFFLEADADVATSLTRIATWLSTANYTAAAEAEFLGSADYYLIAHAHARGHTVVTHERPDPARRNRAKIPDVCDVFEVPWTSPFPVLTTEGVKFVLAASVG